MSSESHRPTPVIWRQNKAWWMLVGTLSVVMAAMYNEALRDLLTRWEQEEYSHGYLIPLISLFLLWQKKDDIEKLPFHGSWLGLAVLVSGIAVFFMGTLSTIFLVVHYSLLIVLAGLLLSFGGWRAVGLLWVPVFYLFFMIPLPPFLYNQLSDKLQLISSEIGVSVIRLFGISVFLEGNVIDLGHFKLQVVEACDGLRYLFPLTSFGFLCAYLYKAPVWQRAVIFLSSAPITVLMNSFRIGVIGLLVEYYGIEQAEGFLHDFEGWFIFMACVGIMFMEMWLLNRFFTRDQKPLLDVFGIEMPAPTPADAELRIRSIQAPFLASVVLLAVAAVGAYGLGERQEVIPQRNTFADFPLQVSEWTGVEDRLEQNILAALHLTDYIIANYQNPLGEQVNFYVAYYDSQRAGESAHSPRSCIPGGGWKISGLKPIDIEGVQSGVQHVAVNRLQIQKGEHKQLVYYWFKQRQRYLTSEYRVKWYLFWDSLTRNRSDGALVRLTTALAPGEPWEQADARLMAFSKALEGRLTAYVPD